MEYAEMLARAKSQLPETLRNRERFEIIKVKGLLQGNKTVLSNMVQIADQLRRPLEHIVKYLTKELATKADTKQGYVILNAKIPSAKINEKISAYVEVFVMCKQCARPDTTMTKNGPAWTISCQACGAKYTAKGVI
jgi:putative translation initiation factor aIF-2 beta subunit